MTIYRYKNGQKYLYMLKKLAKMLRIETEQPGYQHQNERIDQND